MKIGIDLGGSHIAIGLIKENGEIIKKVEEELLNSIEDKEAYIQKKIVKNIDLLLKSENIDKKKIKMIGIACPGIVTSDTIIKTNNLKINKFPLGKILYEYYQIPVFLQNDAKCAAIAEKEYGCLKKYQDAVFLTIGTGVGGAIFYQNKLIQPNISESFEVGHMVIKEDGKVCNCGKNGCFERYASIRVLKEFVKEKYEIKEDMTGLELHEFINQHYQEQKMRKIIQKYIKDLSIGISNIITLYKPQAIGFGGSFTYYQDIFMQLLEDEIKKYTYSGYVPKLEIAKMKNDAGMVGASRINK